MNSTTPLKSAVVVSSLKTSASPSKPKKVNVIVPPIQKYYGCDHVRRMLESVHSSTACKSYTDALRVISDITGVSHQHCDSCKEVLRRTILCLQCRSVNCFGEALNHATKNNHMLGVDSRSGAMYCFMCEDYTFDPTFEKIRASRGTLLHARKKRKIDSLTPTADELRYIEANAVPAPCRATGLRGFHNMGNTCFMSVILQALVQNPLLRQYYLTDGHKARECQIKHCMSCCMDEIFTDFFGTEKIEPFGPVNILTASWKCSQALAGYKQQDAHEYLQFLLNQLHLNCGGTEGKCECIVHRLFRGVLQSEVTCERCRNVTTTLDPVLDLSLGLRSMDRKVRAAGDVYNLLECLDRFTDKERLGRNEYTCSNCKRKSQETPTAEAVKQLTIKRLPPVLCIQIKRFEHFANGNSAKIETRVRFPLALDMLPYTTFSKSRQGGGGSGAGTKSKATNGTTANGKPSRPATEELIFDLHTVVVHIGKINGGHYVSYSRQGGQWFKFNDHIVQLASEATVLSESAYLLFYVVRNLE